MLTIDEARRLVIASAGALLAHAACPDNRRLEGALWGRDGLVGESLADQALARAHGRLLQHVKALGYGADAVGQLEGICSAAGLEDNCRDHDFVVEALGDEPIQFTAPQPYWPRPFAA